VPRKPFVDWRSAREFGRWVAKVREKKGLSRTDVAKALGVSLGYYSRLEAGARSIARREDFQHALAQVLDLDPLEVRRRAGAREVTIDDLRMQLESAASALAAARSEDKAKQRLYRFMGARVLDVLKFARDLEREFGGFEKAERQRRA
jgi:transcriptional regulator with XRE-family HTH domain